MLSLTKLTVAWGLSTADNFQIVAKTGFFCIGTFIFLFSIIKPWGEEEGGMHLFGHTGLLFNFDKILTF